MIKFLIHRFIKNHDKVLNSKVREDYSVLSGVVGIFFNMLLFGLKLTIGLVTNSIAVISDAFNNLTDLGSSAVSIVGAKMSNRPPDEDHPQGHGRFEYVAALVVAFIIFMVGFQLLTNSWKKVLHPETVTFSYLTIAILTFSVAVKFYMYAYNIYIGKLINSSINRATAFDSLSDTVATGAVIVTTIIARFTTFPIDGLAGLVISGLILYSGFKIAKDTVDLLLGKAPDPKIVERINQIVSSGAHIMGTHDLIVHDYGPNRIIASIHAEVSDQLNIVDGHTSIDELEHLIIEELGIDIIVHLDPVCTDLEATRIARAAVLKSLQKIEITVDIEHFRIAQVEKKTIVIFELGQLQRLSEFEFNMLRHKIKQQIEADYQNFEVVVNHRGHNL
ncbi:MAG: cation diffusion facilitator family transporter [Eubacteriales bacterium]|nr:cation diffusion facilitator family transporter [Eubacteriales bacterium]